MTGTERLAELGQILAAGLRRLHARKSSPLSADCGDSSVDFLPDQRSCLRPQTENGMKDHDTVLARIAALKTTPTAKLKEQWTALFDRPAPPYSRRFLESRLAYRIRELAYGGLKPETVRRLEQLGEQLDGGNIAVRRVRGGEPAGLR